MSRRAYLLFAGLAVAVSAGPQELTAQTVRGVLVDEHTGEPIALGKVMLVTPDRDSVSATLTDDRGYFALPAGHEGTYQIVAEAFGYWSSLIGPFDLADGADRIVEARVSARPVAVEGVTVETESTYEPRVHHLVSNGYYERMGRGLGEFITPGEIAMSNAEWVQGLFHDRRITQVFQVPQEEPRTSRSYARVENRATRVGPWGDAVVIRSTNAEEAYCTPWVYLDGIRVLGEPESLAEVVSMRDVEAIEIYRAPFEIELEFLDLMWSECGALVIWTHG